MTRLILLLWIAVTVRLLGNQWRLQEVTANYSQETVQHISCKITYFYTLVSVQIKETTYNLLVSVRGAGRCIFFKTCRQSQASCLQCLCYAKLTGCWLNF